MVPEVRHHPPPPLNAALCYQLLIITDDVQ